MYLTSLFSALSDANRRKIIDRLKKGEATVSEIGKNLDVTMATLSHHLTVLKNANLISGRREGQQIFYSINLSVLEDATEKIIKYLK